MPPRPLTNALPAAAPVIAIAPARAARAPLLLASPHSGSHYPPEFLATARLERRALRQSEDCFVDELIAAAPDHGAPVLKALFPRVLCDVNRQALELDPALFAEPLPPGASIASPRVAAGLGVIPRLAANEREIYGAKLTLAEAERRLERYYRPYHEALRGLIAETRTRFGHGLLLDCHSMPSIGGVAERDHGERRLDCVLGDCFGASCGAPVTDFVEAHLRAAGLAVRRNQPYAGGFVTQHYGRPASGIHVLQIEINRALYMDERSLEKRAGFAAVAELVTGLIRALAAAAPDLLRRP